MFKVVAENGTSRRVESRAEAEDVKSDMEQLGLTVSIEAEDGDNDEAEPDGGEVQANPPHDHHGNKVDAEVVDMTEDTEPTTTEIDAVAEKDISTDPLNVMPGHFVDTIQGVPTINRKGYAVLAEHYGISVVAEPVTLPGETDFEYAEFKAVATTEDETEYSGFGSAHIERQDGDDPHLLAELAETRAMKRATAWATGVGMTAQSEMENSL